MTKAEYKRIWRSTHKANVADENKKRRVQKTAWFRDNYSRIRNRRNSAKRALYSLEITKSREQGRQKASTKRRNLYRSYVLQTMFGSLASRISTVVPQTLIEVQKANLQLKRLCKSLTSNNSVTT